jgi:hypothetical protein
MYGEEETRRDRNDSVVVEQYSQTEKSKNKRNGIDQIRTDYSETRAQSVVLTAPPLWSLQNATVKMSLSAYEICASTK